MRRTRNQIRANDFDLRLYRLISEAAACAGEPGSADPTAWRQVRDILSEARPAVRRMMAEEDRKATD